MSEWKTVEEHPIRTDEKLPEQVLLWGDKAGVALGFVHHFADGDSFTTASGYHGFSFSHWMPLPKPPVS